MLHVDPRRADDVSPRLHITSPTDPVRVGLARRDRTSPKGNRRDAAPPLRAVRARALTFIPCPPRIGQKRLTMCIVVALGRLVATPEGEMPVVASTVDLLIPTEPSKLKSSVKRTYTALRCRASSLLPLRAPRIHSRMGLVTGFYLFLSPPTLDNNLVDCRGRPAQAATQIRMKQMMSSV